MSPTSQMRKPRRGKVQGQVAGARQTQDMGCNAGQLAARWMAKCMRESLDSRCQRRERRRRGGGGGGWELGKRRWGSKQTQSCETQSPISCMLGWRGFLLDSLETPEASLFVSAHLACNKRGCRVQWVFMYNFPVSYRRRTWRWQRPGGSLSLIRSGARNPPDSRPPASSAHRRSHHLPVPRCT